MNDKQIRGPMAAAMGALLVGAWFGYFIASGNSHRNAIDQNCAFYNSKTGEFTWGQP